MLDSFPIDHSVQHAVPEMDLGGVLSGSDGSAHLFLNGPERSEANVRPGLCKYQVSLRPKRCVHLPGRRVAEDGDQWHATSMHLVGGDGRLRHLHEREDAFLDARSTAVDDCDGRKAFASRQL